MTPSIPGLQVREKSDTLKQRKLDGLFQPGAAAPAALLPAKGAPLPAGQEPRQQGAPRRVCSLGCRSRATAASGSSVHVLCLPCSGAGFR